MLKTKILLSAVFLLAFSLFGGIARAADNAGASLSMSGATYAPGATFSVTVFENSASQTVNVAEADLVYDPTQLDFISIDGSTSAFGGSLKATGGQGAVSIIRYAPPGIILSGNVLVSTITFKALAGTSASTIGFSPTSSVYSSGANIWDGQNNSATYSFASPAQPAPTAAVSPPVSSGTVVPPVKKVPLTPLKTVPKTDRSIEGLATAKNLNNSQNGNPPASNPLASFLIAAGLSVATFVAMFFNAHERIARHAVRISKKSVSRLNRKRRISQGT
jgi:hypothetical protein